MNALAQLFPHALPRLAMFDLDGTLVDSVPDLAAAVDTALVRLGKPAQGLARIRDWVGNGAPILVRRALAGSIDHAGVDDDEAERALALFMEAYAGGHPLTEVYPGVKSCLAWLDEQGVTLAVVTNKPAQFVEPLLQEKGLGGLFRYIVGGDTLPLRKPDPAGLQHVMGQAGVAPEQALFVGDSRSDILAARAAGVACVGLRYGYNHGRPIEDEQPDLVLDDLRALLPG